MRRRQALAVLMLVVAMAAIALYLNSQRRLLVSLQHVSVAAALSLAMLRLLSWAATGLFLREYALRFGIRLSPQEWFGLSVVTTMGNYLTPFSGGVMARAAYLKHRHVFSYAQFATLLSFSYLVIFWVIGVVGVVTSLLLREAMQFHWQIAAFFAAVVVFISVLFALPSVKLPWNNRLARIVNTSLEGWALVKNDWALLARLVIYTLFSILLNAVSFWVAYRALKAPASFGVVLLVSQLTVFSNLVNVTPGNLGIPEAVVGLSSGLLGAGSGPGLLATLLIRAATVLLAFTLGPIFSFLLTREVTKHRLGSQAPASEAEQLKE
jgi:uncharacterized membrane protein YbhN (UPF0104 family)